MKIKITKLPSNILALGGVIQNQGSDWSTGLVHIDAGQSHELNPYDGVQMGADQNGVPNLVEENETVWNDYVFSARINADEETKKKFHLPKKKDITYADISKKLEKEIAERPNDPISRKGFETQMAALAEEQERQKAELEAARAREAFEALSDEEKVEALTLLKQREQEAVMQQAQQQEAMAQQAAQEQAMAEGAVGGQQPIENEAAMQEQALAEQQMMEQPSPEGMAEGGHLFAPGGYKWDAFSKRMAGYKPSLIKGNVEGHYRPDAEFDYGQFKDIEALEADDNYKAFTRYVIEHKDDPEVQAYLKSLDAGTHQGVKKLFDGEKLREGWEKLYEDRRNDQKAGIYHLNPLEEEMMLEKAAIRAEENGKPFEQEYPMIARPAEAAPAQSAAAQYGAAWAPENGNPAAKPQGTVGGKDGNKGKGEDDREIVAVHRAEWPRYAGLFGPAVGLGMMAAGVGKPNYKDLNAALDIANSGTALADYKPLGDYLAYRPMDIWPEQNRLNANSRATERQIMNSGVNQGAKIAGLLASGYNDQIANGELYRKALEYNDALRERTATFNRGTNQYNADAYNRVALTNASALNQSRQARATLALQAAREKMDADAGWYNSLYGNVSGLFKGLSELGRENAEANWRNALATAGAFGVIDDDALIRAGYAKRKNKKSGLTV